jgi:hypothetical protein
MAKSLRSRLKTLTATQKGLLLIRMLAIPAQATSKECMKNFGKQWKPMTIPLLKSFLNLTTSKKVTFMTLLDNPWFTKRHS